MKRVIASKRIQAFKCPRCHNRSVHDVDRDVYHVLDVEPGDTFICDECGSEFTGSFGYHGVKLTPAVYDEEW